ncbi:MAG: glycosyltransferase [Methanotrichaceae archaeon]|nr:glycosyltransferase [Methanotrichaceae archaeon]
MTLIYIINGREKIAEGISKKFIGQCRGLRENGLDAILMVIGDCKYDERKYEFVKQIRVSKKGSNKRLSIYQDLKRQFLLYITLERFLRSANSPDIIYLRYPCPILYFFRPISRKIRKCKLVFEHNTMEQAEYKLSRNYLFLIFDLFLGKSIRINADGIVCVTTEISNYQIERSGDPNKPHITIGNGINTSKFKVRQPPIFDGVELNLLFVANIEGWHGIDMIIKGLGEYEGATKIKLHIVGDGAKLANLKRLSCEYQVADLVIFHGVLKDNALDLLFDVCHIAVASLGMHRIKMKMTSALKIREYTARGIPFIISAHDPDFPEDYPYMLKLSSEEGIIDLVGVLNFASKVYEDRSHHIKMREYACKNLDWFVKMKALKKFLEYLK